jgi:hypothetical protein
MLDIHSLLGELAKERPIFHSEADFQHAFAWLLHRRRPELSIRLEIPIRQHESALHVDLVVFSKNGTAAIELKYKTRALRVSAGDEQFHLADQSAQDLGRYDFIKDVCRLEALAAPPRQMSGCAILLTNDSSYWNPARDANSVDAAFRIHCERTLCGSLSWGSRAAQGTIKSRESALVLQRSYKADWRDYSKVSDAARSTFRYLALRVGDAG